MSPAKVIAELESAARRTDTPTAQGRVCWRRWGQGEPLVLLHGATGSWLHWVRNIPALAARFQVWAPDLPGFGDSGDAPEPHTAESLAAALVEGIGAVLPGAPLRMACFSFGSIVGGLAAAQLGRQVPVLVFSGSGGLGLPSRVTGPLQRLEPGMNAAQTAAVHRHNLLALMIADPARVDELAVHVQAEHTRRTRFRSGSIATSSVLLPALPRIEARLCGIWGGSDAFAQPTVEDYRLRLAEAHPELDFRIIPGVGHWAIYEAAEEATALLLELLAAP